MSSESEVPASVRAYVDERCDEFEKLFFEEQLPEIESYLVADEGPRRIALLQSLVALEVDCRRANGETPTAQEYITRFPKESDFIEGVFRDFSEFEETHTRMGSDTDLASDLSSRGAAKLSVELGKRYEIRSLLGSGGFGEVHLAWDTELGRKVAIKVPLLTRKLDADQFLDDARVAAKLTHPNLISVYDVGRLTDGRPFIVMQYVEGGTLAEKVTREKISLDDSAVLMRDVANAVHYAHTQGIVHRDLKPSNILISADGTGYVADFGLAIHESAQAQRRGDASGTPHYRSPEQVRGQADWIDGRSDIWALGVMLYQLVTHRRPFDGTSFGDLNDQIKSREVKPPRQIDDNLPEWVEEICLRCLAKSPADRYPTADAVATALSRGMDQSHGVQIGHDAAGNRVIFGSGNVVVVQGDQAITPRTEDGQPEPAANPYKGLAAFDEHDAELFFGRQDQVSRLWDTLRDLCSNRQEGAIRLLPIVGPSGCGKSSLARAGLIAELSRTPLPGTKDTRVAVLTPGARPIEALASVLAQIVTDDPAPLAKAREFETELRATNQDSQHDGLRRIAMLLPDFNLRPLVILVDQFEEIYSLCKSPEDRLAFVESLLCAAADASSPTSVVITLRSDFLGDTQDHSQLNRLVSERGVLVPGMNEDELRDAIRLPAQASGYEFDDAFVELLIHESEGREGVLPLLQFALGRVWQGLVEGHSPTQTLRRMGGVGGALASEAQRLYEGLSPEDQQLAKRALLAMVQLGEGTRDTRRRTTLGSMTTARYNAEDLRRVLQRFAAADTRLVTIHGAGERDYSAEVTHEALIENWPTLQEWLTASRDDLRLQRRAEEAAQHWDQQGRPEGILWRSPDLDLLEQLHDRAADSFAELPSQFFAASEQQQAAEQAKEKQKIRIYQIGSILIAILATAAIFFGLRSRQDAAEAVKQTGIALAQKEVAQTAKEIADGQRDVAMETSRVMSQALPRLWRKLPARDADLKRDFLYVALKGFKDVIDKEGSDFIVAAAGHRSMGDIYIADDKYTRAMKAYKTCCEYLDRASEEGRPGMELRLLESRAIAEDKMGDVALKQRDLKQARQHYDEARRLRDEWLRSEQENERAEIALAQSDYKLAFLMQLSGNAEAALPIYEAARDKRFHYLANNEPLPANASAVRREGVNIQRQEFGGAIRGVGIAKRMLGRYEESIEDLLLTLQIWDELLATWEKQVGLQNELALRPNLAQLEAEIGQTYYYLGDYKSAKERFEQARQKLARLHADFPGDPGMNVLRWTAAYGLGTSLIGLNQSSEAQKVLAEALDLSDNWDADKAEDVNLSLAPLRMLTLARSHQRNAARRLGGLIEEAAHDGGTFYVIGCGYALCARSCEVKSDSDPETNTAEDKQRDINKALDLIETAAQKGFRNRVLLRDNPELVTVRERGRFQRLLKSLEKGS